MAELHTEAIRNLAFVGHTASGKTALAEALARKASGRPSVSGESPIDLDAEEREQGHSLFPKLLTFSAENAHINLIDTPGAPDLVGPSIACLAAVETAVVVIHAQHGIEPVTRQMMDLARARNLPRVIVINGVDRPHIDLKGLVADIRKEFGAECMPINLPAEWGRRVEDCLLNSSGGSDLGPVVDAHRTILEQVVELDETLMERYLGGAEPDYAALHTAFEHALDAGHVVPICFTSAAKGVGIPELLSVISHQFPSPLEGNPQPFVTEKDGRETPFSYAHDPAKPFLAHVFRIMTDPILGKIAVFRVHQGTAQAHRDVFVGRSRKPVRLGHLFGINGRKLREIHAVVAGDIGGVPKVEDLEIGDVLHEDHALDAVRLTPPQYPVAEKAFVITAKARHDDGKLMQLLHRYAEEDPTLQVTQNGSPQDHIVKGLGDLTLKMVLKRVIHHGVVVETRDA
jgi:elongation factor G